MTEFVNILNYDIEPTELEICIIYFEVYKSNKTE